jgi:predicted ATP-grasp superfamily ATP-dependent carboligase
MRWHSAVNSGAERLRDITGGAPDAQATASAGWHSTSREATYDALVLDAHNRQSLVAVRSLGKRSLRVAALDVGGSVPTFASRWCQKGFTAPAYDHSEQGYVTYLQELLEATPARVLIPSSDGTIALLRAHRECLERRGRIALALEPALQIAVSKEKSLEVARHLGLNIPQSVIVRADGDVHAAVHEIGLPAVVKPIESWMRGKQGGTRYSAWVVTTTDEARRAVKELLFMGSPSVLFQQLVTGQNESVSLLYAHGTVHARFAMRTKRSFPPHGGFTVLGQSIAVPEDIGIQAEHLVRAIELEGYAHVQFRRDDQGKPYLMEINPRLNGSMELAVRAGVDFPYLLYQWAVGARISSVQDYRKDVCLECLAGDARAVIAAILERGRPLVPSVSQALRDFGTALFLPARYESLDWEDLMPILVGTTGFVRHALGHWNMRWKIG